MKKVQKYDTYKTIRESNNENHNQNLMPIHADPTHDPKFKNMHWGDVGIKKKQ